MLYAVMPALTSPSEAVSDGDSSGSEPSEPPQPDQSSGGGHLEINDRTRRLRSDELELIQDGLSRLIEQLGVPCVRFAVEIVDDQRMCLLHQRWHDDPTTTDVLSFPMSEPGAPIDADVACCLDEAQRRAEALEHDRARELVLYALHGLLHVVGHDDHDEASYRRMHAEEDRLLESVGLGALFGPGSALNEEDDS